MNFINYMIDYFNGLKTGEIIELGLAIWLVFGGWKKVVKVFKRG